MTAEHVSPAGVFTNVTQSGEQPTICWPFLKQRFDPGFANPGKPKYLWIKKIKMVTKAKYPLQWRFKVAWYSFSRSTPPKFKHKLHRYKQRFEKIATTVVLLKDENLLWSGLQWHRSCHSNEMTPLPILLAAVFLGTGNCSSKIVHGSFFLQ